MKLHRRSWIRFANSFPNRSSWQEPTPGGRVRYRLLETLRQYAARRLSAGGEADQIRNQHADYYLALAERAEPESGAIEMMEQLDVLDADRDNVHARPRARRARQRRPNRRGPRPARHTDFIVFKDPNVVQMRVALAEIEPVIWRRLVVPWTFHLGQLHHVIQAAFGWWDYHLHQFLIGGLRYGDFEQIGEPEFDGDSRGFDETEVRLLDFGRREPITFVYEYDFGDGWEHVVEFERWLTLESKPRGATCIDGARARPPEDVGGVHGYLGFLEIMADPKHPEHADTKRWAGGYFDPEWFDLRMTDRDVRSALRANRPIRMHQPSPGRRKRES